jgi:hypothetical protein
MKSPLNISIAALILAGCGDQRDITLEQCERGLFFAECPGSAAPVLACQENHGRCRWFSGGVPADHRASDCPPDDICCHATADGQWPFDGWAPRDGTTESAFDIAAIGRSVVDARSPAEIEVILDPTVGEPNADGSQRIRCSTDNPLDLCSRRFIDENRLARLDLSYAIELGHDGLAGSSVYLEIIFTDAGPIARTFVHEYTDLVGYDATMACQPSLRLTTGTLHLSTFDFSVLPNVHGILEAEVEGGHWVWITF